MKQGLMTREEAVRVAGIANVNAVEALNCDFTNRVMDWEDEFAASVNFVDGDGYMCVLTAYYYQDKDDVKNAESLDMLDWDIEGYTIE